MSTPEQQPEPKQPEQPATPPAAAPEPTPEPPKPTETVDFWKTKAREQEARAKANSAAATKLAALEESQKSEVQRAAARAEAAEKRVADLEAAETQRAADAEAAAKVEGWKAKIAETEGIPASALRGNTEAELKEHAQQIKALLPDPNRRGGAYVPAEGRGTGSGGNDPAAQFAAILRQARGQ